METEVLKVLAELVREGFTWEGERDGYVRITCARCHESWEGSPKTLAHHLHGFIEHAESHRIWPESER